MTIRVGIGAFDSVGKRVAEGILAQPDMSVSCIRASYDGRELIQEKWDCPVFPIASLLDKQCDILISDRFVPGVSAAQVLYGPISDWASHTIYPQLQACELSHNSIIIPDVDLVAACRALRALNAIGEMRNCFSTVITCHQYDSRRTRGYLDALQPVFGKGLEETSAVFGSLENSVTVKKVCAPCTRSNLHIFMIDFADTVAREMVMEAFHETPRLVLGSSKDGFVTTADLHEYSRDLGNPRGDRYECFIWDESVLMKDNRLVFMMDVCPESTLVPEMIDSVRMLYSKDRIPPVSESGARVLTDESLGIRSHHQWGIAG